jgi:hypothetical protein
MHKQGFTGVAREVKNEESIRGSAQPRWQNPSIAQAFLHMLCC